MDSRAAASPHLSLNALRGAVGGVVAASDDWNCWDRLVSIWRIFLALDGLIAVLWAIVHRLRAGDELVGEACSAGAASAERVAVAGPGSVRRRVAAGVRAVAGRRVLAGATASVGRVRRYQRARVAFGRVLAGVSPVLAVRCRRSSELGWVAARNCALIVPL